MSRSVTIREIARRAGVSHTTVSNVLNRTNKEKEFSPTQADQIRKLAAELGYVPNHVARAFRLGKTNLIALLTFERLYHPYQHEAIEEILAVLNPRGYQLNLALVRTPEDEEPIYRTLVSGRYDGVIICGVPPSLTGRLRQIIRQGLAVVVVGSPDDPEVDSIDYDRALAVRIGVTHLLQNGHTRVGLILDEAENLIRASRLSGYRQALTQAGRSFDERLLFPWHPDNDPTQLWQRISAVSPRLTALYSHNDEIAVGLLHSIRASGLRVPADVAIVAQGNSRLTRIAEVPLTVVDTDTRGVSAAAVELLLARIKDPHVPIRRVLKEPRLVVRASSGK